MAAQKLTGRSLRADVLFKFKKFTQKTLYHGQMPVLSRWRPAAAKARAAPLEATGSAAAPQLEYFETQCSIMSRWSSRAASRTIPRSTHTATVAACSSSVNHDAKAAGE